MRLIPFYPLLRPQAGAQQMIPQRHTADASASTQDAPLPTEVVPPSQLQGLAILVVDDNATNRIILQTMLRAAGLQPTVVNSAKVALETLRTQTFHAILIDAHMPEMDGFTLATEIEHQVRNHGHRIMMLTTARKNYMPPLIYSSPNRCHQGTRASSDAALRQHHAVW